MALHYYCRHCGMKVPSPSSKKTLQADQLGFNQLNDEERQEMIVYHSAYGDIQVKAICEDCYESLQQNPGLYENDYIIH